MNTLAPIILYPWKTLCKHWAKMLDLPEGEAEQQYQNALNTLTSNHE